MEGFFRFSATDRIEELARSSPVARYGVEDGLTSDDLYPTLYEDAAGDLWFATVRGPRGGQVTHNRARSNFGAGIVCLGETIIRGNTIRLNGLATGGPGIQCQQGMVLGNFVTDNEGPGLESGVVATVVYDDKVFEANNDPATPANQVIGNAIQLGPDICEGVPCP